MRKLLSSPVLGVILFCVASHAGETTLIKKLELVTEDSLTLTGWLIPASNNPPPPLVILLHAYQSDHTSYDYLLESMNDAYVKDTAHFLGLFPHTVTFDLRGHGASAAKKDGTVIDYQERDTTEMKKIPSDIALGINSLLADSSIRIDKNKIFVVGASIGANAAALVTELVPDISKIVLMSPGENYVGMRPAEAVKKFSGKTLIYASVNDSYSNDYSKALAEQAGENVELKLFRGSTHGIDVIYRHPTGILYMMDWLFSDSSRSR